MREKSPVDENVAIQVRYTMTPLSTNGWKCLCTGMLRF